MSSATTMPSRASAIAGFSISASVNLPEPYFSSASANPATVPGTPMPSAESRDFAVSGLPSGPRNISRRGRRRRGLAIVDRDVLVAFRRMDHHEAAAADIARARIGHGHGKAGRHRGIDRIAAALQHVGADPRRDLLLRHHHAVLGGHGMNRVGGRRRRRLRRCSCAAAGMPQTTTSIAIGKDPALRRPSRKIIKIPPRVEASLKQREARCRRRCYMGSACHGQNASA